MFAERLVCHRLSDSFDTVLDLIYTRATLHFGFST